MMVWPKRLFGITGKLRAFGAIPAQQSIRAIDVDLPVEFGSDPATDRAANAGNKFLLQDNSR